MATWGKFPDEDAPKAVVALAEQVERDGGLALALYREPGGDHWQIFCLLPMDKVEPTPYQRDISPTHAKRKSPPRGAGEAQGKAGAGHPRARARGRLPDPGTEHGESAQPQGEVPR